MSDSQTGGFCFIEQIQVKRRLTVVVSTSSHTVTGSHLDLQMHTHTQTRCPASVFLLGYHLMCVQANRQQRAESLLSEMNVECWKWETGCKARFRIFCIFSNEMSWFFLFSLHVCYQHLIRIGNTVKLWLFRLCERLLCWAGLLLSCDGFLHSA